VRGTGHSPCMRSSQCMTNSLRWVIHRHEVMSEALETKIEGENHRCVVASVGVCGPELVRAIGRGLVGRPGIAEVRREPSGTLTCNPRAAAVLAAFGAVA